MAAIVIPAPPTRYKVTVVCPSRDRSGMVCGHTNTLERLLTIAQRLNLTCHGCETIITVAWRP